MTTPQILAIIPARAGSKGIPNKNIVDLHGKPLIQWTIDAAQTSGVFDRIVLASDGSDIRAVGESIGIETMVLPDSVTTDTSHMREPVNFVLNELSKQRYDPSYFMLLQPTSPLRTAAHIQGATAKLVGTVDGVIGVYPIPNKTLKALYSDDGEHLYSLGGEKNFTNMPRILLPDLFMPNGAIHLLRTAGYRAHNNFFFNGIFLMYVMEEEVSIDVDSPLDLERVAMITTSSERRLRERASPDESK